MGVEKFMMTSKNDIVVLLNFGILHILCLFTDYRVCHSVEPLTLYIPHTCMLAG